jgi:hypothetical protein
MERYRILDDGRPAGTASSDERRNGGGVVVRFDADLSGLTSPLAMTGEARLDDQLGWQLVDLDIGEGARRFALDPEHELEVPAVPAFYGVTTRRLMAEGMRPGQAARVEVLRLGLDFSMRRLRARYTWVGGQSWCYDVERERAWLAIRPADGVVRSVADVAQLQE